MGDDKKKYSVKTFGVELRPMKAMGELALLDQMVNDFLATIGASKVVSVSDTATTDDKGETIGLIRVVCYRT